MLTAVLVRLPQAVLATRGRSRVGHASLHTVALLVPDAPLFTPIVDADRVEAIKQKGNSPFYRAATRLRSFWG